MASETMRLAIKLWAVVLITLAFTLIVVNVLYTLLNAPNLTVTYFHAHHKDWFAHPGCEDRSPNCAQWVQNGNCEWSWLCQVQCQASCDRCHKVPPSLHKLHPFAGLVGFQHVADIMQRKVDVVMHSEEIFKSHAQIEKSNFVRATKARIDKGSCRLSVTEYHGADLSHYDHLAVDGSGTGSLNEACSFRLTPVKPKAECEDDPTCAATAKDCMGAEFRQHLHICPKMCAECGACVDQHDSCHKWSAEGQCFSNPGFMLERCRHSCIKACSIMYDPHPPHFVALWNGLLMPTIGFGTAGLTTKSVDAVLAAITAGYRHIDSAEAREWYREDLVGQALAMASVPRDEIFITTKVHPKHLGYTSTLQAFAASLHDLKTPYVDLLLLHYSHCFGTLCQSIPEGTWKDSWRAMEDLVRQGQALAIGVSNFQLPQLVELVEFSSIPPSVIQSHSDPFTQNLAVRRFAMSLGIQYTAYSSLGTQYLRQTGGLNPVLENPAIHSISTSLGISTAQAVLKYTLGTGQVILPRSQNPAHINESLQVPSLSFAAEDIILLYSLDGKLGLPKDT